MASLLRGSFSLTRSAAGASYLKQGWQVSRLLSESVGDAGSHDDFKPQIKNAGATTDVFQTIKNDISSNRVFVYMKGVPDAPQCGFSMTACRILDAYGAKYGSRNVLEDPEMREGIKKFSNWPTIPQVYVNGEFVGGCDILMQMHETGELTEVLKKDEL